MFSIEKILFSETAKIAAAAAATVNAAAVTVAAASCDAVIDASMLVVIGTLCPISVDG